MLDTRCYLLRSLDRENHRESEIMNQKILLLSPVKVSLWYEISGTSKKIREYLIWQFEYPMIWIYIIP